MALRFETGVQNLIYQVDQGTGRSVIRRVLTVLTAVALAALYLHANFRGLKDARAMEEAQLARNLAENGRLETKCVRPLALGIFMEEAEATAAETAGAEPAAGVVLEGQPDVWNAPVWPAVLSLLFRAVGNPSEETPGGFVYFRDYLPTGLAHLFVVLSAIWVWAIGRRLFGGRVAMLSVFSFLLCDWIWRNSVTGNDFALAMFFTLGAVAFALRVAGGGAAFQPSAMERPPRLQEWLPALMAAAVFTAMAFLTRYAAGGVILGIFLFIGCSRIPRSWGKACFYVALSVVLTVPWGLRNLAVCGHFFGLAPYASLAGTYLFEGDSLMRTLHPEWPDAGAWFYAVQLKMVAHLRAFLANGFGLGGAGVLAGFFVAMYAHRFNRASSRILRWCILASAAMAVLAAAVFGDGTDLAALAMLWPLAIPYAWAFALVLFDRLQLEYRSMAVAAVAGLMTLSGLSFLLNVLPPRTGIPYPPYYHAYAGWVSGMLDEGECMATDIPWATAWYGGKVSILLPADIEGFYEINNNVHRIPLLYFTTLTRDKPWVRGLSDPASPEYSWYLLFSSGRVPGGFPLTHARYIGGTDQMLLADRPRW